MRSIRNFGACLFRVYGHHQVKPLVSQTSFFRQLLSKNHIGTGFLAEWHAVDCCVHLRVSHRNNETAQLIECTRSEYGTFWPLLNQGNLLSKILAIQ